MEIINHIEMRDGTAVIRGHGHLKAKMVAWMHVLEGQGIDAVMSHYGLTAAEVHAAVAYYYDNRDALEAEYEQTVADFRNEGLTLDQLRGRIAARRQDNERGM